MKQIKPYLFILAFLAIPLLLVPIIRSANSNFSNKELTKEIITQSSKPYGIVIRAGDGNFSKTQFPDSIQSIYNENLNEILLLGYSLIEKGESAHHIVNEVIQLLENSTHYNAGSGSVNNDQDLLRMDASIMDGKNLHTGTVNNVSAIKNPIKLAHALLLNKKNGNMSGKEAESFAQNNNFLLEKPTYSAKNKTPILKGSVGCVVLDKNQNLAAGCSLGKDAKSNETQINSAALISAGLYAKNKTCAISCSGNDSYFIVNNVAFQVSSRMELLNESLLQASTEAFEKIKTDSIPGGFIAMDMNGNYTIKSNIINMLYGVYTSKTQAKVQLYQNN